MTRRAVLSAAVYSAILGMGFIDVVDPLRTKAAQTAEKPKLTKLEKALVPIVMCRTALTPVRRYIDEGAWDKARTNINYCKKNLALRKRIRDTAESGLDGDAFYDALSIAGDIDNSLTQLDASVYTPIFVASDEGISPEQEKYQQQAYGFYEDTVSMIDRILALVSAESLDRAKEAAKLEKFEIKIDER